VHEKELKEFLDENKIKYVTVTHSTAYTAQEVAALTHTKGKDFAKTVMVMLDGTLAMAVVPASYQSKYDAVEGRNSGKYSRRSQRIGVPRSLSRL
jgi:Ala-tRNA(Pro) deacylase